MSNRHRSSKEAAPGAALAPSKEERKAQNRKVRHRTHELLAHADIELGEEIVAPRPVHTRLEPDRGEIAVDAGRPRREFRHWKQKFWKRRNNVRAQRAVMASTEMPLPEIG
ncbi:MAG TPA: hypothetical protein VFU14_04375 [Acidimicrobiales bacterium]|nr:hypothetical protein [Acidimicrobiales bacterium]